MWHGFQGEPAPAAGVVDEVKFEHGGCGGAGGEDAGLGRGRVTVEVGEGEVGREVVEPFTGGAKAEEVLDGEVSQHLLLQCLGQSTPYLDLHRPGLDLQQ